MDIFVFLKLKNKEIFSIYKKTLVGSHKENNLIIDLIAVSKNKSVNIGKSIIENCKLGKNLKIL